MEVTIELLTKTINTVKNNIAVTNDAFQIQFTNAAWDQFGILNGVPPEFNWVGVNYYLPCQTSAQYGDEFSQMAIDGLEKLRRGELNEFQLEYPCHSQNEERWFLLEVTTFDMNKARYYVISHMDITHRVKLEMEALRLSKLDGLTHISNRRAFDAFIESEWRRCRRNTFPLSLLLIDVDDFKFINDTYGHQAGDACLLQIAQILQRYTARASDMCARFGGDEFIVAWSHISPEQAVSLSQSILHDINRITVGDNECGYHDTVSVSLGLSSTIPDCDNHRTLLSQADTCMYQAKEAGKNTLVSNATAHSYEPFTFCCD